MEKRLALQAELEHVMGSNRVYFQPPTNVNLKFPCIVYHLADIQPTHANNDIYNYHEAYTVTLITRDPDSPQVKDILKLHMCRFDRRYVQDDLYHSAFRIYR